MHHLTHFLKGVAMGAANVIPGVSGGTIALITGVYERLIQALRQINPTTARLVFGGKFREAWTRVDGAFLFSILFGVGASILSLARLFEWLLVHHEILTMACFFGLILASIFYVARDVKSWGAGCAAFLVVGTAVAVGIAMLAPATENANPLYVFACGVVAICSMILPGLSGSFVLILMGNYALVLGAINTLDLGILVPLAFGCGIGLLGFAQVLGWVFKRFHDATLAVMTGFVLGSLVTIWPWKEPQIRVLTLEEEVREVITGYAWHLPDFGAAQTWFAFGAAGLGAMGLVLMEGLASKKSTAARKDGAPGR